MRYYFISMGSIIEFFDFRLGFLYVWCFCVSIFFIVSFVYKVCLWRCGWGLNVVGGFLENIILMNVFLIFELRLWLCWLIMFLDISINFVIFVGRIFLNICMLLDIIWFWMVNFCVWFFFYFDIFFVRIIGIFFCLFSIVIKFYRSFWFCIFLFMEGKLGN